MSSDGTNYTNPNPWGPPETPDLIAIEHANFRGLLVIAVAYGFFLAVAAATLYFLICKPIGGKRSWGQIAYTLALLAGGTIYLGPQAKWIELMFIDDRNFPGDPANGIPPGPDGFFFTQTGDFSVVFSTVAYVVDNFLADAMMLYRCALIWNFNWFVLTIPGLWLIASTVLSILLLIEAADPAIPFKIDLALPYFPLSMSLNVFLALLTAGKLLWARHKLRGTLGSHHTKVYSSIASMIIESSALYSITSLIYIILYGTNNSNAASEVLGLLGEINCISPMLIVLRVAYGRGISRETVAATSTALNFSSNGRTAGSGTVTSTLNVKMTTDTHSATAAGSTFELKRMGSDSIHYA